MPNKEDVFVNQESFEKYVLDVHTDNDREEIMHILSQRIIRILLREEFNFLYMKDLNNFKFSLIINILFKEFSNEWLSYALEYLHLSHEDAVEYMQDKKRVVFLLDLVKWYFKTYKLYFTQEIADTFIELIDSMLHATLNNELINSVIESDFLKKGSLSIVYSYNQLWTRVKSAHNEKNEQVSRLQIRLHEVRESQEKEKIKKLEYDAEVLNEKSLAFFDESIMRVRNTMTEYMLSIDSFKY